MKKPIVVKIGGSCLSKPDDLRQLVGILSAGEDFVLVVSAFKNVTNLLECWYDTNDVQYLTQLRNIHKNIFMEFFPDEDFDKDFIMFNDVLNISRNNISRNHAQSLGEYMSSGMVEKYLQKEGVDIAILFGDPLIFGDSHAYDFKKSAALITSKCSERIHQHVLTQGFVSRNSHGERDNLGREGSDLTAVIWAKALETDCILYKDVGGIYTSDPRKNPSAKIITEINFENYKNDFYLAGVIYNKVIDFCIERELPLSIYSFDTNILGTKITI